MRTRVKSVVSSLEIDSNDVHVIGIKGMGGSKGSGLKQLQKQVLQDVLNDLSVDVKSVYDGKSMMKKIMSGRKVVVVLDDVDHIEQLEALAGNPNWFKPGSRIIITTRDEQEAIRLFSRNKCEWVDAIKRLEHIPLKETLEKLELSYNGLESDQKEIFLDVVCMLKGEKKDDAIKILESCGFHAQIGLRILEQKSLIIVSNYHTLGFHGHIEEMGKNIVRRFHPNEPSEHSRLWIKKEIEDILVNESGANETRSIRLVYSDLYLETIIKGLRKMKELRFLHVSNKYGIWEVDKVLDKLRYINLSRSNSRAFDTGVTPHLEMLVLEGCHDFVKLHMPVECSKLKCLNLRGSK
ncbi:TMV resistance protein N-like, partial [Bidens hawaiensis]|uniref:TMV resistance protein N-like n=1 Tax=Bidens hawaiensis TaxID=980011 RepID=UPI00404AC55A